MKDTEPRHKVGDMGAIVVHHRSYSTVGATVRDIIAQGVAAERVLVVDNSEQPECRAILFGALPDGTNVIWSSNDGYGAAVNTGVAWFRQDRHVPETLLVSTHEVRLEPGCLESLATAMDEGGVAAAGPTLLTRTEGTKREVWSLGGKASRVLLRCTHVGTGRDPDAVDQNALSDRRWLDGALVLYRTSSLPLRPFMEEFFLYIEEVDLHLRLQRAGERVVWVSDAVAYQSTSGTPPFYFARNTRLLARRHLGKCRATLAPIVQTLRSAAACSKRRDWASLCALARGARAPLPAVSNAAVVVNPLGGALRHYTEELRATLEACDWHTDVVSLDEPSVRGSSRTRWLIAYLHGLVASRRLVRGAERRLIVVTWPVLGYLDMLLIRALAGRAILVIHDPDPLVRAIGLGAASARMAAAGGRGVGIFVHSAQAREAVERRRVTRRVDIVPHPVEPPSAPASPHTRITVSVLGQWKRDRDLRLMKAIAGRAPREWDLRVIGRGWPSIPGWRVDDRFVSEAEFDARLMESSVVLIPYRRFFQSGVAIRALEKGVPVVGPRDSVLADILGRNSPLLAGEDRDDWMAAIQHGVRMNPQEMHAIALEYFRLTVANWHAAVGNGCG